MSKITPAQEKIVERKMMVYKTLIDPTSVKIAGEKLKNNLFAKFGFLKPRPEEIQSLSIKKYYEQYFVVDGKYTIDYYRKHIYTLKIDPQVKEVILLEKAFRPGFMTQSPRTDYKVIELEGEERLHYENKAYLILDEAGREVNPKRLSPAPSEEKPKKILAEFSGNVKESVRASDEEVEILRSKIVRRPSDVGRVVQELFEVSESTVIYTPVYQLAFKNVKTGEVKTLKIDGVTAKVI